MKKVKKYCLIALTLLPISAIAFAAKSALSVAQIRSGTATVADLQGGGPESIIKPPEKSA